MHAQLLQSCPTLGDSMDCSPTGSSVHGILQARTLEWDAIAFSNNSLNFSKNVFNLSKYISIPHKTTFKEGLAEYRVSRAVI